MGYGKFKGLLRVPDHQTRKMFYFKVAEVSECKVDYVPEYRMDFNFGGQFKGSCQTYDDEIWLCFFHGSGGTQCKMYSKLIFY